MNNQKTILRICALALAVLMLGGCSAVISNPVVAKVGDVEISYSQFANLFDTYSSYGMVDTSTAESLEEARTMVFDDLVEASLPLAVAHSQNITLTEEETAEAMESAQSILDSYLSSYMDDSIADENEREAAAIEAFDAAYKSAGITYAQVKEETEQGSLDQALGNKVVEQEKAKVPSVTEEEVRAWYDEQVEAQKEEYAADPVAYYTDSQYYSYYGEVEPLVAPEGLFYVKHILIMNDEATQDESSEDTLSDSSSASFRDSKALAETVLEKVQAGEDFDKLIEDYGEDPGMTNEPNKSLGYLIGEGFDSVYDKAFYDAAMELKEEGDTSGIVEGSNGYHIIRRCKDVSTEPLAFEEVEEEILNYLNSQKQNEVYQETLAAWREEIPVTLYEKRVSYVGIN